MFAESSVSEPQSLIAKSFHRAQAWAGTLADGTTVSAGWHVGATQVTTSLSDFAAPLRISLVTTGHFA
jgi:hypothetical protein